MSGAQNDDIVFRFHSDSPRFAFSPEHASRSGGRGFTLISVRPNMSAKLERAATAETLNLTFCRSASLLDAEPALTILFRGVDA